MGYYQCTYLSSTPTITYLVGQYTHKLGMGSVAGAADSRLYKYAESKNQAPEE